MNSNCETPINLGNPEEFTIIELSEKISDLFDDHLELVYQPLPEDDPERRQPDISKAIEILGWQPQIPLKMGLKNTIAWFKNELL